EPRAQCHQARRHSGSDVRERRGQVRLQDHSQSGLATIGSDPAAQSRAMDTFFQQLINGLSLGAIYALIALGYTMVYGVLRLINFAHGDVYMLGAFAGYFLANSLNLDRHPSIFGAIAVTIGAMGACALVGIVIE